MSPHVKIYTIFQLKLMHYVHKTRKKGRWVYETLLHIMYVYRLNGFPSK